jgi:hypothetical protein
MRRQRGPSPEGLRGINGGYRSQLLRPQIPVCSAPVSRHAVDG